MDIKGEGEGWRNWEVRIDIYTTDTIDRIDDC